jgi:hypothetical protein
MTDEKTPNTQPLSDIADLLPQPVERPDAIELGGAHLFERMHRPDDRETMIRFGGVLFRTERGLDEIGGYGESV